MARLIERTFDPTKTVTARRFFVAAGRHFNPGDVFDWRRMAINQRRVRQLFDNGKLMHTDSEPVVQAAMPPPTSAPTVEQEVEDMTILAVAAAPEEPQDELDDLNMRDLRAIAAAENAPFRVSRAAQRDAIREARRGRAGD